MFTVEELAKIFQELAESGQGNSKVFVYDCDGDVIDSGYVTSGFAVKTGDSYEFSKKISDGFIRAVFIS